MIKSIRDSKGRYVKGFHPPTEFTEEHFKTCEHPRGMLNKHHSEEAKRKIIEHHDRYWLGKKRSYESKIKQSEARKKLIKDGKIRVCNKGLKCPQKSK